MNNTFELKTTSAVSTENHLTPPSILQVESPEFRSENEINAEYKSSFEQEDSLVDLNNEGLKSIMNYIMKLPLQISSIAFGIMYRFVGLKWYNMILFVVIGAFIFFQIESALETRRNKINLKKEGMHRKEDPKVDNIKNILKNADDESNVSNKNSLHVLGQSNPKQVSFGGTLIEEKTSRPVEGFSASNVNLKAKATDFLMKLYNLWILPWMYVLFRSISLN